MQIEIEVVIGDGKKKPKIIKMADGTYSVRSGLGRGYVAMNRALWAKSFIIDVDGIDPDTPQDGKGFLVGLMGKLKKG